MDNLIYDRLSSDVDTALNNPDSTSSLKGAYNYTDLNRVETWCEYIENILIEYGFVGGLILKKNWNIRDYPTRTHIDRIRNNIKTLRDYCRGLETEVIVFNNTMNYVQANVLEKILADIDQWVIDMTQTIIGKYNIASITANSNFLFLQTDTTTEDRFIDTIMNYKFASIGNLSEFLELQGAKIEETTQSTYVHQINGIAVLSKFIKLDKEAV